ncbi:uncharacterized protein DUF262 [Micrococcus sp. 140720015-1]
MESSLSASAVSAGELFSNSTFLIPPYQREFAWTDENLEQLWGDLRDALHQKEYFLGLIVLTKDGRRYSVVDGQQRILAVTLLAAAIRKAAKDLGRIALFNRLTSTFLTSIDYATDEDVPRVRLSNAHDDQVLRDLVSVGHAEGASESKLAQAYARFSRWVSQDIEPDPFGRLGAWAEFLIEKLMVALFVHPDRSAAYGVFEVINNRGRGLTTADLLKSYILSETSESDRDDRYARWQEIAIPLNQASDAALVQFIRHITMMDAGFIQAKELYSFLADKGQGAGSDERRPPSVDALVEKMDEYFPLYMQILDPANEGPSEGEWINIFNAFNDLGVITVRPLLMAITRTPNATEGLASVLRIVVRRIVVGNLGTGNVERRFAECARQVTQEGSWETPLRSLGDLNPSADDFRDRVAERSFNRGTLSFLRRSQVEGTISPASVSTLHLIRPRQANDWTDFPPADFTFWGSTVGNTVLIEQNKRPNGAVNWEAFKKIALPLVCDQDKEELEKLDSWTARDVQLRGKSIADELTGLWYE